LSDFIETYTKVRKDNWEDGRPIFCDTLWDKAYKLARSLQGKTNFDWLVWMDLIGSCIKLGAGEEEIIRVLNTLGYEVINDEEWYRFRD
jgi:hypothetical protein